MACVLVFKTSDSSSDLKRQGLLSPKDRFLKLMFFRDASFAGKAAARKGRLRASVPAFSGQSSDLEMESRMVVSDLMFSIL